MPHSINSSEEITKLATEQRGHVRSFVLRQGRVSNAQQRYYEEGMPRWGIPYAATGLDLNAAFANPAPVILEIGCGMGETTAIIAAAQPDRNFIGIEVHTPGVGALLKEIATRELKNLRVIQHDAVEVVRDMIAPGSLAGIHIFFPDPWPKKRHHKRRLIQGAFVHQLALRLVPGGYIHCATDWEEYAQQMLEVLSAEPLLKNTNQSSVQAELAEACPEPIGAAHPSTGSGRTEDVPVARTEIGFVPRPDYRPQTKFETRGLRLGHGVWDMVFTRLAESDAAAR
jgi:tRNA (guanine-N7-)-methyltransferase